MDAREGMCGRKREGLDEGERDNEQRIKTQRTGNHDTEPSEAVKRSFRFRYPSSPATQGVVAPTNPTVPSLTQPAQPTEETNTALKGSPVLPVQATHLAPTGMIFGERSERCFICSESNHTPYCMVLPCCSRKVHQGCIYRVLKLKAYRELPCPSCGLARFDEFAIGVTRTGVWLQQSGAAE